MMRYFLILALVSLPCVLQAQITWDEHTVSSTCDGAFSICSSDVDNDGDLDIFASSSVAGNSDEIYCYLNNDGMGTDWIEVVVSNTLDNPYSLESYDIDGDGDKDVISAIYNSSSVTWFENVNGDGLTWISHNVVSNINGMFDIAICDIDNDGDYDVVGASVNWAVVFLWRNVNGDGITWDQVELFDIGGTNAVSTGDIDGDGDEDICASSNNDQDTWWFENMDGGGNDWEQHYVFYGYKGISTALLDVNGDEYIDIVGCSPDQNTLFWFENTDGTGLVWNDYIIDGGLENPRQVICVDIDFDGDNDVVCCDNIYHMISYWINTNGNGSSWLEQEVTTTFWGASGVTVGDIDSDGDYDIGGVARNDDKVAWWQQNELPEQPTLILQIVPQNVIIPSNGGELQYDAVIVNNSDLIQFMKAWTVVILPNGNRYGPLHNQPAVIPVGTITIENLIQEIPDYAPEGNYTFVANLGYRPIHYIVASDSFAFEKQPGANTASFPQSDWRASEWQNNAWEIPGTQAGYSESRALPRDAIVESVYPNPFNASTTLTVNLPEASELAVAVYNIKGQKVVEIASGSYQAGMHWFAFDATNLASGLYFIRATVPGYLDQVQKVMLVR